MEIREGSIQEVLISICEANMVMMDNMVKLAKDSGNLYEFGKARKAQEQLTTYYTKLISKIYHKEPLEGADWEFLKNSAVIVGKKLEAESKKIQRLKNQVDNFLKDYNEILASCSSDEDRWKNFQEKFLTKTLDSNEKI